MPAIKVYNLREVDELILLDISAQSEGRPPDYISVSEFSQECFVPLTVGGGITSIDQVKNLLRAGADKVSINTEAYKNPGLISDIADTFGAQCVVASIDVRKNAQGFYECFSQCGQQPTGWELVEWAKKVEKLGAGEILVTSIENDGMMQGYDLELIKAVTDSVGIPVIASGGAGSYQHFYDAIIEANASAVAAASIFHFTEQTPLQAKLFLSDKGVPVRRYVI